MNRHVLQSLLIKAIALTCTLMVVPWTSALAQTSTGTVRGYVKDADGNPLPSASVVATEVATNFQRGTLTTQTGFYNLPGLSPGNYTLKVTLVGYGDIQRPVRVGIGQAITMDISMSVQAIEIAGIQVDAARGVETRTSEVATNITQEQIENVPINDRNFLTLALLAPGVRTQGGSITSGAQSANNINVFLDGVTFKNDMLVGGVVGQDASLGNPFPQAAVQEFRVITQQYKAEYQKATSVVVSATTKSGTNEWKGEAFLFGQNKDLVNEDFFTIKRCEDGKAANPNFVCAEQPKRDKWQGGLSVGGPLMCDRLFFFGTYEGHHQNRANTVAMNNGDALRALRPDIYNQLAVNEGTFDAPVRSNLYFGKLTYVPAAGSPHRFELSSSIRDEYDLRDFGGTNARSAATQFVNDVNTFAGKYQYSAASWLNELSASFQRYQWHPVPEAGRDTFDLVWRVNGAGVLNTGGRCCNQDFIQNRWSLRNDLSYTLPGLLGDHVFKFGGNFDKVSYDITQTNFINPRFIFDSRNDYAFPIEAQAGFGTPGVVIDNNQIGLYAQDDWSVSERLALNIGVRWDYESNEENNDYVTPAATRTALETYRASLPCNQPATDFKMEARQLICDLDNYITDGTQREPFMGAIQPRLGFSYDLFGGQRTVLFGGFGVYYDRNRVGNFISEIQRGRFDTYTYRFSSDGAPQGTNPTIKWEDRFFSREGLEAILTSAANPPAAELHLNPNDYKPPKTHQYSLGVRQSLGRYQLQASYNGVRGYNFFTMLRANRNVNGSCCQAAPSNHWSNLFVATQEGKNWYDALLFSASKTYTEDSRWGAQISYTLGKAEETVNANDRFGTLNEFVPSTLPRYPSANDERHHVTANWTIGLPFDIRYSGILDLGSGTPFNSTVGFGAGTNACTHGNQDCLAGNDYPEGKTRNWYRPPGQSFILSDFWQSRNVDMRLEKRFPTFGGQEVGVIFEVFNVFDYANYTGYNTNYGSYQVVNGQVTVVRAVDAQGNELLGTPTAVVTDLRRFGAPRRFQLGMRYQF